MIITTMGQTQWKMQNFANKSHEKRPTVISMVWCSVFGGRCSKLCWKLVQSLCYLHRSYSDSKVRWDETRPTDINGDNSRMAMVMVMTAPLPHLIPYSLFHDEHINFYCLYLLLNKAMMQRICALNNADTRRDAHAHIHKTRSTAKLNRIQLILHALQRSK